MLGAAGVLIAAIISVIVGAQRYFPAAPGVALFDKVILSDELFLRELSC